MSMVFCRGCGKEIHETAVTCPLCGAPQNTPTAPEKRKVVYTSYDQVPWYRKEWFAWLSFFVFTPALGVVLLTGDSYYTRKGQLKTVSKGMKIFFSVLAVVYLLKLFGTIATEFSGNDENVKMVKNGKLSLCPNATVDQMVDSFMDSPSWESGETKDKEIIVNVSGGISFNDKPVKAVIQFKVDRKNETFGTNALEFNEVPQALAMAVGLLKKMCESVN